MARRPPATLADYVLVGLNPALIMILIDSLVFYLLAIFYGGGYDVRVMFIFAMFIMGAVAVCRISMEEGAGYAANFGFPLGLVALFALNGFGGSGGFLASLGLLINAGIIGFIWYLAYQLTWDCTLFDERADTSDQGLLQAAGLEGQAAPDENVAEDPIEAILANRDEEPKEEMPPWLKWFERSKQPHAHGVWVIYFSLLALPAFGLGQWFLPSGSRMFAFQMLVIYAASALALLLSTSFLGLRRYLRKRRLEMPAEMTANWLIIGGIIIVVVLAVCVLIPRPGAEISVAQLPFPKIGNDKLAPSSRNVGNDGQKQDPNARAGSTEQTKQPGGQSGQTSGAGDKQGQSGQSSNQPSQQPQNSSNPNNSASQQQNNSGQPNPQNPMGGQPSPGGQKPYDPMNKGSGEAGKMNTPNPGNNPPATNPLSPSSNPTTTAQNQQPQSSPQQNSSSGSPSGSAPRPPLSSFLPGFGPLLNFLMYVVLAAVLGFLAWRYRRELAAALQQLLKELRELWARLFGGGETKESAEAALAAATAPPRSFAAFTDPFLTGRASQLSRLELLRYTFEAMQAWGRERGCPREASETPHEYAQRLASRAPELGREAVALSDFYGQAAYAGAQVPATVADPLRSLWHKMGSSVSAVA
jgi:hypothetical protein